MEKQHKENQLSKFVLVKYMHYKPLRRPVLTVHVDCSCMTTEENVTVKMSWALCGRDHEAKAHLLISGLSTILPNEDNNEGEFKAVIQGIKRGLAYILGDGRFDFKYLAVVTDSLQIYKVIKGEGSKFENARYAKYIKEVKDYEGKYTLFWVFRGLNDVADLMAKQAILNMNMVNEEEPPVYFIKPEQAEKNVTDLLGKEAKKENWKPYPYTFPNAKILCYEKEEMIETGSSSGH